jgi:hypothetical protein
MKLEIRILRDPQENYVVIETWRVDEEPVLVERWPAPDNIKQWFELREEIARNA